MPSWETSAAGLLRAFRLESIRSKILVFAVLATLIPSLSTAWLSYRHNRQALSEKLTESLRGASQQASREVDLWFKELLFDLRVFASSYEVTENVGRGAAGRTRLSGYLRAVRGRYPDYSRLTVVDLTGRSVASSETPPVSPALPAEWQAALRNGEPAMGPVRVDSATSRLVQEIVVPITSVDDRILGALAATVDLGAVATLLGAASAASESRLLLADRGGNLLLGAGVNAGTQRRLPAASLAALADTGRSAVEYQGVGDAAVLGFATPLASVPWLAIAELPAEAAFAQVRAQRNTTILVVALVLLGVGLLASALVLLIVRPLGRLTEGARKVAGGDLDVDLPVTLGGEIGYLTQVFNNMVARLRESRTELERLGLTDGLTGLFNRRHLKETILQEFERSRRSGKPCAILMLDIDHFKHYNDTHGHLAGDEVLVRVAAVIKESIRTVDRAVRYGGEEVLVLLAETGLEGAVEVAERIRARLLEERFAGGRVTVCVGAAAFPDHGESAEALILSADAALYEAKQAGRDRVRRAGVEPTEGAGTS